MKFRNFRGEYTGGDEGVKTSVLAQQRFSPCIYNPFHLVYNLCSSALQDKMADHQ